MMLALTVKQPWASLIMAGVKTVENRGWPPPSTLPQWQQCPSYATRLIDPELIAIHDAKCEPSYPDGPFPLRLWIHAGKRLDRDALAVHLEDIRAYYGRFGTCGSDALADTMEYGSLLGTVSLTGYDHADDCYTIRADPYEDHRRGRAYCSRFAEPDAFHWQLADPQPLTEPIPMRGAQKLWRLPDGIAARLEGS